MNGFLKKILPVKSSSPRNVVVVVDDVDDNDNDNDNNVEYSFAIEYKGPPLLYEIPQVVPVDIDCIQAASVVVSGSMLNELSFPIIQPIVKRDPLRNKFPNESNSGSKASGSMNIVSASEDRDNEGNDHVSLGEVVGSSTEELSHDATDGSDVLGLIDGDERKTELSDEIASSGSLKYSGSDHDSHELTTGSSNVLDDNKEGIESQEYSNPTNCVSVLSYSSSQSLPFDQSSCVDSENGTPHHVRNRSVVTFRDLRSSDMIYVESGHDEADIIDIGNPPERKGKKGSCYRCGKGNRFTEKEVCIVCDAKFCGNCVMRAMGSMPEGRKCITCIGKPINELKRLTLGKCSRLLKRLRTKLEIKQIMGLETLSKVNQLPAEFVFVNGKPLCQEEMVLLQSCPNPPKKLKPGYYWYDKVAGLWGMEGQQPCQIISPELNIGDPIRQNASNGNTDILINNREITKVELWMLKLAGIECEGHPRLWVDADGSYQEEGMQNVKGRGRIWDRTGMKLVCAVLSLPIPSEITSPSKEEANGLNASVLSNHTKEKTLHTKLLLVGFSKSGTSTIFKQSKLLYNVPFTEDERQNIKFMIQRNLYGYLGILLEGRQKFEEETSAQLMKRRVDQPGPSGNTDQNDNKTIYSVGPRLKSFCDWLLKVRMSGNLEIIFPAAAREYAPFVEELWKNAAIQATYNRRSELEMLPRAATYFLDRAVEISRIDYEPSATDILYAEGITLSNGIASMEFSFPRSAHDASLDPVYQHDQSLRYQLIRVHPSSLGDNCKWLDMFEDVGIVIFCVDLTDYDQFFDDGDNGYLTNKMMASKKLFESVVTHPTFYDKDFLLILNKFDLLEEKIEQAPLTQCEWFSDFKPLISRSNYSGNNIYTNPSLAQRAFHYIGSKFKTLYKSLNGPEADEHVLYVKRVTALESDTVDEALRYAREIQKWKEGKPNFSLSEFTSYSVDVSSSSRYSH